MNVLWVDDFRTPPEQFTGDIARTYDEAITFLSTKDYQVIFLDHDLGLHSWKDGREYSGYDVVTWLVNRKNDGLPVPGEYQFLTANPVGRKNMEELIVRYLL